MLAPEAESQCSINLRRRRRHQKSKKGCFECKRRRVKCDEKKPSCARCLLTLDKCGYPPALDSTTHERRDELFLPSPACTLLSVSPNASLCSGPSPSFETSKSLTPAFDEINYCSDTVDDILTPSDTFSNATDDPLAPSDTSLYHHYLQHTCHTLTQCPKDQGALQIGMPTLALQSKTVFHSVLAVSAACMCFDMISKECPPSVNTVNQTLLAAYRHYTLASEQMRELISGADALKPEALLASAVLLVPFATASQQINHWISVRRSELQKTPKPLSITPRDVIVLMRGIRTTLQALDCGNSGSNLEMHHEAEFATEHPSSLPEYSITRPFPFPSQKHMMFPILAATSQAAFSRLQDRLDKATIYTFDACHEQHSYDRLSACAAAFEIVNNLRINTFSAPETSLLSPSNEPPKKLPELEIASLPQITPWLRSYINRPAIPRPTEPLTKPFLTFLVQVPQSYLDLVLPLLDQRLERPNDSPFDYVPTNLTKEQALALDIYAHWSVLMFLVEEESWWIGNLPDVTLTGMVNSYGDDFVARLWPEDHQEQWWPGSMLTILREIKRNR